MLEEIFDIRSYGCSALMSDGKDLLFFASLLCWRHKMLFEKRGMSMVNASLVPLHGHFNVQLAIK
jgi:hypothetical protein